MKLAVIGSREFSNKNLVADTLDPLRDNIELFISGGARGADKLGERWANKNNIPTEIYYPDHKQYRHPYHHRNRLIVEACDKVIAFWDGHSTGTKYTINYAKTMGKEVEIIRV